MRRFAVILFFLLCVFVPSGAQTAVDLSHSITLTGAGKQFSDDFDFLNASPAWWRLILHPKDMRIKIVYGEKFSEEYDFEPVSGAYRLNVTLKGIVVAGYDEKGAYYGIQELRRMVEQAGKGKRVPLCSVKDAPENPVRGLVEGYYGETWSSDFRKEIIRQMSILKMNTYLHIPSEDDPQSEAEIQEICRRYRVDYRCGTRDDVTDDYYAPLYAGESLKLSIHGAAAGMWKSDHDAMDVLDYALNKVVPDARGVYKDFMIHTTIYQDAFPVTDPYKYPLVMVGDYRQDEYDLLMAAFRNMEAIPAAVSGTSNEDLYELMKPCLDEYGDLGARCCRILECLKHYDHGNRKEFWNAYILNLMSQADKERCERLIPGTESFQRYHDYMMDELHKAFDARHGEDMGYMHFKDEGVNTFITVNPSSRGRVLMDNPEGREVIVRLADGTGKYTAEFCAYVSDFRFDMKGDAIRVEVLGDIDVFEVFFE